MHLDCLKQQPGSRRFHHSHSPKTKALLKQQAELQQERLHLRVEAAVQSRVPADSRQDLPRCSVTVCSVLLGNEHPFVQLQCACKLACG